MVKSVAEIEAEIKQLQRQITGIDAGLFAMINEAKDELIVARWLEQGVLPEGTRVRSNNPNYTLSNGVVSGPMEDNLWIPIWRLDGGTTNVALNRYHLEFAIGNQWYNVKGEKV